MHTHTHTHSHTHSGSYVIRYTCTQYIILLADQLCRVGHISCSKGHSLFAELPLQGTAGGHAHCLADVRQTHLQKVKCWTITLLQGANQLRSLTLAPYWSMSRAVARPMPCAAPVIRATLFANIFAASPIYRFMYMTQPRPCGQLLFIAS